MSDVLGMRAVPWGEPGMTVPEREGWEIAKKHAHGQTISISLASDVAELVRVYHDALQAARPHVVAAGVGTLQIDKALE